MVAVLPITVSNRGRLVRGGVVTIVVRLAVVLGRTVVDHSIIRLLGGRGRVVRNHSTTGKTLLDSWRAHGLPVRGRVGR